MSSRSRLPLTGINRCRCGWSFGVIERVGIEGTGAYGAGLARHFTRAAVTVIEVDRPDRRKRRQHGKSDQLDAVEAARGALSGRCEAVAKSGDGHAEALRALLSRNDQHAPHGSAPSSSCAI